jgi:Fic family protein
VRLPQKPPDISLAGLDMSRLEHILMSTGAVDSKGRYLHWDELRSRTPPHGLTVAEWWIGTKLARGALARPIPLRSTGNRPFTLSNVDQIQESVHHIDQQASGQILAPDEVTNLHSSDRYLVSSLIEEAITSSQLEGASTTRKVAKVMLATGRPPRNRSEQMIANNLEAMFLAEEMSQRPLTPTDVRDLHRVVALDTLDDPEDAGRLQRPGDERIAVYVEGNEIAVHYPPPAGELPDRLEALCDFANGGATDGFLHPVVRAIILHFWLAYDHPFVDGNGRTARALFYWSMLRDGYWLSQYLSISSILRKAPVKYARSYLYTETDDCDLTYFVINQLGVIERAIQSLHDYLGRKTAELRELDQVLHGSARLNNRQLAIVHDALRDPSEPFTIDAQRRRHRVTYESARSDLRDLEGLGLFTKQRIGKKFVYRAAPDLPELLSQLGAARNR